MSGTTEPRYRILGPLRVTGPGGEAVAVRQPLQRTALGVLLAWDGEPCPRAELAAALWGGSPPADLPGSLRTLMYGLRRVLGPGCNLGSDGSGYFLGAAESDVDARLFRSLADAGRHAWYGGDADGTARLLGEAIGLWREPGLEAIPDVTALAGRRKLLRREYRDIQDLHADALLAAGQLEDLVTALRAVTASDPGREHAWALLARSLAASGDPDGAAAAVASGRAALASARAGQAGGAPEIEQAAREITAA